MAFGFRCGNATGTRGSEPVRFVFCRFFSFFFRVASLVSNTHMHTASCLRLHSRCFVSGRPASRPGRPALLSPGSEPASPGAFAKKARRRPRPPTAKPVALPRLREHAPFLMSKRGLVYACSPGNAAPHPPLHRHDRPAVVRSKSHMTASAGLLGSALPRPVFPPSPQFVDSPIALCARLPRTQSHTKYKQKSGKKNALLLLAAAAAAAAAALILL